jgi:CubicO group peptidase (beta-lactamase class C family)
LQSCPRFDFAPRPNYTFDALIDFQKEHNQMRIHNRGFATVFLTAAILLASTGLAHAQDHFTKIDALLKQYNDYGLFNGSVLVSDRGKVYEKGFGMANREWQISNTPDTKFRLGSITKQFTATLIMQLVEQGKIKLDGHITDYLPDYRKDTGDKVTIQQLLTHTSGIPSYTERPDYQTDISKNTFSPADFVKKYASGDLEFAPGTKFSYDNGGYFILGAIIEKLTGKSYEQNLKEKIFDPLGMTDSGYDHPETIIAKRATGYGKNPTGFVNSSYVDMSVPYAAGSLYSTARDLYKWDRSLYTDKILSAASRELMFKPNLSNYGFGFFVTDQTIGNSKIKVISHSGGINGFATLIVRLVDSQSAIILLSNVEATVSLNRISQAITKILYDQPYDSPKRSIAETLMDTYATKGTDAAIAQYRDIKATKAAEYDMSELELTVLASRLLAANKPTDAIQFLKLNTEAFPQSAGAQVTLGTIYLRNGDKQSALTAAKKALEIDPKSAGALGLMQRIEGPGAAPKSSDSTSLDKFIGQYPLTPDLLFTVTVEGGKLMGQATGQDKLELERESDLAFVIKVAEAHITFVKDDKGSVTGLVLEQGGQRIESKKK